MPAEQRVITIGFLVVGLVVAGILYWTIGGGDSVTDTLDRLNGQLYPAYVQAERAADYNAWRTASQDILKAVEQGKRRTIETNLKAEATDQNRDAQRLYGLLMDGTFEKVSKNEFPFEGKFYPPAVHGALLDLQQVVGEEFKTLTRARQLADRMAAELETIRGGSGMALELPEAYDLGENQNPMLVHDAQAFAVFNLDPKELTAAFESKNPGGGANPKRLFWNEKMPGNRIADDLLALRLQLAGVSEVVARFRAANSQIRSHPDGPAAAKKLYGRACDRLAQGLPSDVREAFEQSREQYESGDVIVDLVATEEKVMRQGETHWEALAKAFRMKFAE